MCFLCLAVYFIAARLCACSERAAWNYIHFNSTFVALLNLRINNSLLQHKRFHRFSLFQHVFHTAVCHPSHLHHCLNHLMGLVHFWGPQPYWSADLGVKPYPKQVFAFNLCKGMIYDSRLLKIINVDKTKKPVTAAWYDKQYVCTIWNRFHTRWANNGKITSFYGGSPLWCGSVV